MEIVRGFGGSEGPIRPAQREDRPGGPKLAPTQTTGPATDGQQPQHRRMRCFAMRVGRRCKHQRRLWSSSASLVEGWDGQ